MSEEIKQAVVEFFEKNSAKGKKKMYPKDVATALGDTFPRSEVKKGIQELLDAEVLKYWSSGSTTYVMLKKEWEELQAKECGASEG